MKYSPNYLALGMAITIGGCTTAPPPASPTPPAPAPAPKVEAAASAAPLASTPSDSTSKAIVAGAAPNYDEICHGSIDEAVQRELSARAARGRSCYENLLRRDPRREGRLMVTVKVSETGSIDSASIAQDELGDLETSECVLASFREPLRSTATGNCAVVNIPLRFQRKPPDPPPAGGEAPTTPSR